MVRFLHCFETMYYKKKVLVTPLHTTHYTTVLINDINGIFLLFLGYWKVLAIFPLMTIFRVQSSKSQITHLGLKLQILNNNLG